MTADEPERKDGPAPLPSGTAQVPGGLLRLLGLMAMVLAAAVSTAARAADTLRDDAELCRRAAAGAAAATGVPETVLQAIARVETGREIAGERHPWPWAVNAGGSGRWLPSRGRAEALARDLARVPGASFDLGCFQINHRWHGHAFASVEEMLDPAANAIYAAHFLEQLRAELGSWDAAIGAFHSRTPDLARDYASRVQAELRQESALPVPARPAEAQATTSRPPLRPLLTRARAGDRGSLVPRDAAAAHGALVRAAGVPLT